MQVWLVCNSDCEATSIEVVCLTKEIAERELFKVRDRLVSGWRKDDVRLQKEAASFLKTHKKGGDMASYTNSYKKMIANLSSNDYEHWNNYPHEKPYLYVEEVIER